MGSISMFLYSVKVIVEKVQKLSFLFEKLAAFQSFTEDKVDSTWCPILYIESKYKNGWGGYNLAVFFHSVSFFKLVFSLFLMQVISWRLNSWICIGHHNYFISTLLMQVTNCGWQKEMQVILQNAWKNASNLALPLWEGHRLISILAAQIQTKKWVEVGRGGGRWSTTSLTL